MQPAPAGRGENGRLSSTAFTAGVSGLTLKLVSIAPEIARMRGVGHGTPLYKALDNIGEGATVVCLWAFAVLLAAVATLTFSTAVLPRWLGFGAAATAIALAVNGSFIKAEMVPALLLFLLWTLVASVVLFRRASGERATVAGAHPAAAG